MKDKNMPVEEYTPCRISDIFLDQDGEIEIITLNSGEPRFRLKGVGRMIWYMLDGQHKVSDIVDKLCREMNITDRETLQKELTTLLIMLKKKAAIVANWDPIYKLSLCQELEQNE